MTSAEYKRFLRKRREPEAHANETSEEEDDQRDDYIADMIAQADKELAEERRARGADDSVEEEDQRDNMRPGFVDNY